MPQIKIEKQSKKENIPIYASQAPLPMEGSIILGAVGGG